MKITKILMDTQLKAKPKVEAISTLLIQRKITIKELVKVATHCDEKEKGTCIEALEFATRSTPEIVTRPYLQFIIKSLSDKAPRVKWESAKLIGNIAHLYPNELDNAINNLLINAEYPGTVVRWSAAFALGAIVKLKTHHNINLIPAIEAIMKHENDNAIKKIYQKALTKI